MNFSDNYPYQAPKVMFKTTNDFFNINIFKDDVVNNETNHEKFMRVVSVNIMVSMTGSSTLLHLNNVWGPDWTISKLLTHIVSLLKEPNINLLPPTMKKIYQNWNSNYQKYIKENKDDTPLKFEMISDDNTIKLISSLSRIERMHLNVLFLYLTSPKKGYYEYIQTFLILKNKKH